MESKRLLLTEDSKMQWEALKNALERQGWQVTCAYNRQDAIDRTDEAGKREKGFDFFAIDLGLPPGGEKAEEGVKLALALRRRYKNKPILAYTVQNPHSFDYALVLRHLLVIDVSFVYLRDEGISFGEVVEMVNKGYLVVSPRPAEYLPEAIPTTPDPLSEKHWQALKLLNEGKTQEQVSKELYISPETIKDWVDKIRKALAPLILPAEVEADLPGGKTILLEDLYNWYRDNHVKYCRD